MANILIFVSKTGGGHVSLGEALRDLLGEKHHVELLDPQPGIIHWHYRTVSRHALWLWELEYWLSNGPRRSSLVHTLAGFQAPAILANIERLKPDLIMTTYPFLADEVYNSMRLWKPARRPFVMLLSDPGPVHASWLTEHQADAIFAPTRETYDQALRARFQPERLSMTGWPVRGQFYQKQPDRNEFLEHLGLSSRLFTVFVQGGGEGAASFAQTIENLLGIDHLQVILAVGTNRALAERFQSQKKVHVLPFTKEIAQYMAAADIVMGKAGPNILFESVTLGKPFLATSYIRGQETPNLDFIRRYGLGWVALEYQEQRALLSRLVEGSPEFQEVCKSVELYRNWNMQAVKQIPALVEALLVKGAANAG